MHQVLADQAARLGFFLDSSTLNLRNSWSGSMDFELAALHRGCAGGLLSDRREQGRTKKKVEARRFPESIHIMYPCGAGLHATRFPGHIETAMPALSESRKERSKAPAPPQK